MRSGCSATLGIDGVVCRLLVRLTSMVMRWLATAEHFSRLTQGLVETGDLIYFAFMIGVFLVLTKASVESVRWR